MNEITIGEYKPEDRARCIDLLHSSFGDNSNEHTFSWRFEYASRPKPLMLCAKHHENVVSFLSFLPWYFSYKGKRFLGYQAGELATDLNYRGQGLASKLFNYGNIMARASNIDFFFSFPKFGSPSAKAHNNAGYINVGNFNVHLRMLNPFSKKSSPISSNFSNYNDIFIADTDKITAVFDNSYFEWRYKNNTKDYDYFYYNENNEYAVFILRKRQSHISVLKLNYLMLIDFQVTTLNEKFLNNAFSQLDKKYSRSALFIITFFNSKTDRGRILKKIFRTVIKSKFESLWIKHVSDKLDYDIISDSNNWDILPHLKDEY